MSHAVIRDSTTKAMKLTLLSDGNAVDLTGATVEVRVKPYSGATLSYFDSGANVTITDAPNGKIEFAPAATTFELAKSPYKLQVRVTDSAGKVLNFPEGSDLKFDVQADL